MVRGVLFEDRCAALISASQQLPELPELSISYEGHVYDLPADVSDRNGLPRCKELAELRSRSLTSLSVSMLDGPAQGNALRLSGLPALRTFRIFAEASRPLGLRVDAASFREVPQMQALSICDVELLHLQQGSLTQLTALTSLTLKGCGLRRMPVDVASFGATLCSLDLSFNDRMQIDECAMASIVQCSRLNVLDVYKSNISMGWQDKLFEVWPWINDHLDREGYCPSQWSEKSVRHLVRLPTAF